MNFLDWQRKFATQKACLRELERHRWPNGFQCPVCGHDRAYRLNSRPLHQCTKCKHQAFVIAGTVFENTKLQLPKWFAAIYLMGSDKGGISALRLSKMIGVSWRTAHSMLRKLRQVMGDRDRSHWLDGLVEVDDAYIGGKRKGKRGRGAAGKQSVLLAVERRRKGAGYLAAEVVDTVDSDQVRKFSQRIAADATVRSDALAALKVLSQRHEHQARVTPADKVDDWLPMVHIVIGNLKRFLLGTFHSVSKRYLQEYIHEFVYRFNRRRWESQLPQRILQAAVDHVPVPLR